MNATPLYIFAKRSCGKWLAVCGTNSGGCLAGSEAVFSFHGFKVDDGCIHHGATLTQQKNFKGFSESFKIVSMSEEDRRFHWFLGVFRNPRYTSFDRFVQTFPDAEEFRNRLNAARSASYHPNLGGPAEPIGMSMS